MLDYDKDSNLTGEAKKPRPERDIFFPRGSLEGRNNYKRYVYIDRDGSTTERVYLNILDKRHREEVVCTHFLQFLVRHFIRDKTGINILSRDDPWDFQIELSTGVTFNLEIVSIADNELQYKVNSREEMLDRVSYYEKLPLRQLQKIAEAFPDEDSERTIDDHKREGRRLDDLVSNPFHSQHKRIYVSQGLSPDGALGELLDQAIRSKEAKKSGDKASTVLIVDNRTSVYYVNEVTDAIEALSERLSRSPFKEIWFYNGYCSDWDGNNGEYTVIPIKVTPESLEMLLSANDSAWAHKLYH